MALTIDKAKTAFLSMHFQNDIVHEDGKFASTGGVAHVKQTNCLVNTQKVLEACRQTGVPVIHVVGQLVDRQLIERQLRAGMPLAPWIATVVSTGALTEDTWGAEIHDQAKPKQGDFIVRGTGVNSFYASDLDLRLRLLGIRTVVLSGFATNFVVESTARYACDAVYEVIILRDCCASFNEEAHSFTLNNILPNLATISDSAEFVKALG